MKNLMFALSLSAAIVMSSAAVPAAGPRKAEPRATGSVSYNIYGVKRHAEFNAIATSHTCSYADVTGAYVVDVVYQGTAYPERLVLAQNGNDVIDGVSLALVAGGSDFTVTSGTVILNTITINAFYVANPALTIQMTGTIAPDGSMSGDWKDTSPVLGSRKGTWETTAGKVDIAEGCYGKSTFHYRDENGLHYSMSVKYVDVEGNAAWFAGQITSGNVLVGSWLLVKVEDNGGQDYARRDRDGKDNDWKDIDGERGNNKDVIWGEIVADEAAAQEGVAQHHTPVDRAVISRGQVEVTSEAHSPERRDRDR